MASPLKIALTIIAYLAISMMWTAAAEDAEIKKATKPLKIYLLSGQSNMQGKAKVRTIERLALSDDTKQMYNDIIGADGHPIKVKDTYGVYFTSSRNGDEVFSGPLNPTYGAEPNPEQNFGPEYTFGIYMQKQLNEPFLIIKTAWGGKDLVKQFRSPSSGDAPVSPSRLEKWKTDGVLEAEMAKHKEATGEYYRLMMSHIKEVLSDPGKYHPAYNPELGYEIAGFVWFQGWNDLVNGFYKESGKPLEKMYNPYTDFMANFIRDVRKDVNAPKMPFVIGVLGVDGPKDETDNKHWFRKAQAAASDIPEFNGNVKAVLTEFCWDMESQKLHEKAQAAAIEKVNKENPDVAKKPRAAQELARKYYKELLQTVLTPEEYKLKTVGESNAGYHYNGSAYIYGKIGKAFAEAMIEMSK